jgi:hypothetical protein
MRQRSNMLFSLSQKAVAASEEETPNAALLEPTTSCVALRKVLLIVPASCGSVQSLLTIGRCTAALTLTAAGIQRECDLGVTGTNPPLLWSSVRSPGAGVRCRRAPRQRRRSPPPWSAALGRPRRLPPPPAGGNITSGTLRLHLCIT